MWCEEVETIRELGYIIKYYQYLGSTQNIDINTKSESESDQYLCDQIDSLVLDSLLKFYFWIAVSQLYLTIDYILNCSQMYFCIVFKIYSNRVKMLLNYFINSCRFCTSCFWMANQQSNMFTSRNWTADQMCWNFPGVAR